jgi:vacuolar-type H+-ATPase subunit F/Vma7
MKWLVISNELTAVGWRLAGAETLIADERSVLDSFVAAQRRADVLFITADLAAHLPDAMLNDALVAQTPLTAIIPSLPDGVEPPDLEREVQRALGIGS